MKPRITYVIKFRFNLGKALEPVGELENKLNDHLARMGYDEKLSIVSGLPELHLQVERELTAKEHVIVSQRITEKVKAAFPQWDVSLADFYRKSSNVEQSVKQ